MSDDVTGRVPRPSFDPVHARPDALLVARFAAGDADGDELGAAQALVERCPQCAALADDLRLLASSMYRLPQPVRPRDFQLTQDQAERLPGGLVQGLLRALAAPRWAVARPLAGAAMTIGIVLAVFGSTLSAYAPGSAGSAAFDQGSSPRAVMNEEGSAPLPVAPVPTTVAAPTAEAGGPRPISGQTNGSTTGASPAPQPPSPGSMPENYTDLASPPPVASGASGGQSGFGPETQAPPPATQALQPAASGTEKAATGTAEPQANPVPPTEAGGPPSRSTLVRQALILGGLAVAVLGLVVLLLVSYARRKFRVTKVSRP